MACFTFFLWLIGCEYVRGMEIDGSHGLSSSSVGFHQDWETIPCGELDDAGDSHSFHGSVGQMAGMESNLDAFTETASTPLHASHWDLDNNDWSWSGGALNSPSPVLDHACHDFTTTSYPSPGKELDELQTYQHAAGSGIMQESDLAHLDDALEQWIKVGMDWPPPYHEAYATGLAPTDTFRDSPAGHRQATGFETLSDSYPKNWPYFDSGFRSSPVAGSPDSNSVRDERQIRSRSPMIEESELAQLHDSLEHWIELGMEWPSPGHEPHAVGLPAADTSRNSPVAHSFANECEIPSDQNSSRSSSDFAIASRSNPVASFGDNSIADIEHWMNSHRGSPPAKKRAHTTTSSQPSSSNPVGEDSEGPESGKEHHSTRTSTSSSEPDMTTWESLVLELLTDHTKDVSEWIKSSSKPLEGPTASSERRSRRKLIDQEWLGSPALPLPEGDSQHPARQNSGAKTAPPKVQAPRVVPIECYRNNRKRKSIGKPSKQISETGEEVQAEEAPVVPGEWDGIKVISLGAITTKNTSDYQRFIELCNIPTREETLKLPSFDLDLFNRSKLPDQYRTNLWSEIYLAAFEKSVKSMIKTNEGNFSKMLWFSDKRIGQEVALYQRKFDHYFEKERIDKDIPKYSALNVNRARVKKKNQSKSPIRDVHLGGIIEKLLREDSFLKQEIYTQQINSESVEFLIALSRITNKNLPGELSISADKWTKTILPIYIFYVEMIERIIPDQKTDFEAKIGIKINEAWQVFKLICARIWVPEAKEIPELVDEDGIAKHFSERILLAYQPGQTLDHRRKRNMIWHMLTIWLHRSRPLLHKEIKEKGGFICQRFKKMFDDMFVYATGLLIEKHHQDLAPKSPSQTSLGSNIVNLP